MKVHWACGDVLLSGYKNLDITGQLVSESTPEEVQANLTTLDNYYKYPFIENPEERHAQKRPYICDAYANILQKWYFDDQSLEEIVLISAWEHFWPQRIKDHIIPQICRTLCHGGKFIVDFPDVVRTVDEYRHKPYEMMVLLYCNHTDNFAVHNFGYTESTFAELWPVGYEVKRRDIVKHSYPMIGMEVTKL